MSEAIVVIEAYKKFVSPNPSLRRRTPRQIQRAGGLDEGNKDLRGHLAILVAVDHVSFTVRQGEIFGLLGPHDSGKTTLIRLLASLLLPDSGDIRILGHDVVSQAALVKRLINRVSAQVSFFRQLSPLDNLIYSARLYGLNSYEARQQSEKILSRLNLDSKQLYQPLELASRNVQQKMVIACALISRPDVLLLDDPTAGLDQRSRQEVWAVLCELRQEDGTTILLATRDPIEAESICDRFAIMEQGKIVALGNSEILHQTDSFTINKPILKEASMEYV